MSSSGRAGKIGDMPAGGRMKGRVRLEIGHTPDGNRQVIDSERRVAESARQGPAQ